MGLGNLGIFPFFPFFRREVSKSGLPHLFFCTLLCLRGGDFPPGVPLILPQFFGGDIFFSPSFANGGLPPLFGGIPFFQGERASREVLKGGYQEKVSPI